MATPTVSGMISTTFSRLSPPLSSTLSLSVCSSGRTMPPGERRPLQASRITTTSSRTPTPRVK